jgi:apolipoprotein D and lipocalin family protein
MRSVGLVLLLASSVAMASEPPRTVEFVDLGRYVGRWYEIAKLPQPFQGGCTGTTATYTPRDDGNVGVVNTCRIGSLSGPEIRIEGFAQVVDPASNAKLQVIFNVNAPPGDYWIIDIDDEKNKDAEPYQWAVVSGPTRTSLFILSRQPQLDKQTLRKILHRLRKQGFDLSALEFTLQPTAG